jgi:hypothetical protein
MHSWTQWNMSLIATGVSESGVLHLIPYRYVGAPSETWWTPCCLQSACTPGSRASYYAVMAQQSAVVAAESLSHIHID